MPKKTESAGSKIKFLARKGKKFYINAPDIPKKFNHATYKNWRDKVRNSKLNTEKFTSTTIMIVKSELGSFPTLDGFIEEVKLTDKPKIRSICYEDIYKLINISTSTKNLTSFVAFSLKKAIIDAKVELNEKNIISSELQALLIKLKMLIVRDKYLSRKKMKSPEQSVQSVESHEGSDIYFALIKFYDTKILAKLYNIGIPTVALIDMDIDQFSTNISHETLFETSHAINVRELNVKFFWQAYGLTDGDQLFWVPPEMIYLQYFPDVTSDYTFLYGELLCILQNITDLTRLNANCLGNENLLDICIDKPETKNQNMLQIVNECIEKGLDIVECKSITDRSFDEASHAENVNGNLENIDEGDTLDLSSPFVSEISHVSEFKMYSSSNDTSSCYGEGLKDFIDENLQNIAEDSLDEISPFVSGVFDISPISKLSKLMSTPTDINFSIKHHNTDIDLEEQSIHDLRISNSRTLQVPILKHSPSFSEISIQSMAECKKPCTIQSSKFTHVSDIHDIRHMTLDSPTYLSAGESNKEDKRNKEDCTSKQLLFKRHSVPKIPLRVTRSTWEVERRRDFRDNFYNKEQWTSAFNNSKVLFKEPKQNLIVNINYSRQEKLVNREVQTGTSLISLTKHNFEYSMSENYGQISLNPLKKSNSTDIKSEENVDSYVQKTILTKNPKAVVGYDYQTNMSNENLSGQYETDITEISLIKKLRNANPEENKQGIYKCMEEYYVKKCDIVIPLATNVNNEELLLKNSKSEIPNPVHHYAIIPSLDKFKALLCKSPNDDCSTFHESDSDQYSLFEFNSKPLHRKIQTDDNIKSSISKYDLYGSYTSSSSDKDISSSQDEIKPNRIPNECQTLLIIPDEGKCILHNDEKKRTFILSQPRDSNISIPHELKSTPYEEKNKQKSNDNTVTSTTYHDMNVSQQHEPTPSLVDPIIKPIPRTVPSPPRFINMYLAQETTTPIQKYQCKSKLRSVIYAEKLKNKIINNNLMKTRMNEPTMNFIPPPTIKDPEGFYSSTPENSMCKKTKTLYAHWHLPIGQAVSSKSKMVTIEDKKISFGSNTSVENKETKEKIIEEQIKPQSTSLTIENIELDSKNNTQEQYGSDIVNSQHINTGTKRLQSEYHLEPSTFDQIQNTSPKSSQSSTNSEDYQVPDDFPDSNSD